MAFRRRRHTTRRPAVRRAIRRAVKKMTRFHKKRFNRIPRSVTTLANIPRIQKLRYVDQIGLVSNSGIIADYKFRANSVFDPDYTSTGHQPMRFDQMAAFFADYVVIGSKITVRQIGSTTGSQPASILWIYLDDDTTPPSTAASMIESGKCPYRVTNENVDSRATLSCKFSAKKFFGIKNISDNVSRIGATCTANPADQAYFVVSYQPIDKSSTTATQLLVTIEYIVLFSQPVDLPSS